MKLIKVFDQFGRKYIKDLPDLLIKNMNTTNMRNTYFGLLRAINLGHVCNLIGNEIMAEENTYEINEI